MDPRIEEITEVMSTVDFTTYWTGFKPVAYALYDDENVYLFQHPNYPTANGGYAIVPWTEQFMADTLILFEDMPTAIVKIERYEKLEDLYSILIHELFHGYQYVKGEKRFPDETMGVTYPLSPENVELRDAERASLYAAVITTEPKEQMEHVRRFIAQREKRSLLIGDFMTYENRIETIEGPAWYVELQASADKSALPYDAIVFKYGEYLLDRKDAALHIRKSCYSAGLFMCLLLDKLSPHWQNRFMESELTLFPFFRECISMEPITLAEHVISDETHQILAYVRAQKDLVIETVVNSPGYPVTIKGTMKAKRIDPMNMIASEQTVLHNNFVALTMNGQEYLFQQPVIAHYEENIRSIPSIRVVLPHKPIVQSGKLIIEGVGKMEGTFDEENSTFHLKE
ncbi:hypothetical protein QWT69_16810 [Sporosarcina oncorhynchi]|uniref:Peptide ABC transporter permease n=1 Tax=Sporosarcina oncorhynchi TaxID=3056444 RepID=A0ABZ0L5R4_9BACL|nr:hypothetical protein [Sporosarcina sp. T2O-4]WOV87485.1 hypothetical protein QWT69_16810 [Sporosarcina sp. T2O-4]